MLQEPHMRLFCIGVASVLISSGALLYSAQPDSFLHIFFLDVGQGDSILIRTPAGENILVDGGPKSNVLSELKEALPFFGNKIDYLLLTHPDRDHIEGLISVLKRYPVKHILATGSYKNDYFSRTFFTLAKEKNIPITIVNANSDFLLEDGVFVDVIFPFFTTIGEDAASNSSSLVLKIVYGKNKILLTGDADMDEENKLISAKADIDSDVLKVAHHGSRNGTGEDFLKKTTPQYAVISVGKGNDYHHPHPSTLKRLAAIDAKIFRTDKNGRIEFVLSKNGIEKIKTEKL